MQMLRLSTRCNKAEFYLHTLIPLCLMNQSEFNEEVSKQIERLTAENTALKKQLKSFNNAEELLAKLTIASDQAKSLHDSMMVERKHSAEQSLQSRKLREEQDAAYQARHKNTMDALQKQVMHLYDGQAQTQSMLDEIKAGREEFNNTKESLMQSHDWIMQNMTIRREELERFAAKDYINEQLTAREQEGLTKLQQEHLDRNLRLLVSDPSAFAQQINQIFAPPEPEQPTEG